MSYCTPNILRSIVLSSVIGWGSLSATHAAMVFYMPFDENGQYSLENFGTAGGVATTTGSGSVSTTSVPNGLGSTYSQKISGYGTGVILPNSGDKFRLDTTGELMTLSTWVYLDSATYDWFGVAGIADASGGWSVGITPNPSSTPGKVRLVMNGLGNRLSVDTVPLQSWVHLTMTWNTTLNAPLALYLNGADMGLDQAGAPKLFNSSTSPISLLASVKATVLDDYAMWDTILGQGQIRALSQAPETLDGYNAGVMNDIFTSWQSGASGSPVTVGDLEWSYDQNFSTTGKTLGDVWQEGGNYYMWLSGDAANATGMMAAVPEPCALWLTGGFFLTLVLQRRRS